MVSDAGTFQLYCLGSLANNNNRIHNKMDGVDGVVNET